MSIRAWIAIGAAVGLLAGLAGLAWAGDGNDDRHPSLVTITDFEVTDEGVLIVDDLVASPRHVCIEHRKVKLRHEDAGIVDTDFTDEDGLSRMVVENPRTGTYDEKLRPNDRCKGDISNEIEVE